jgi:uncharacterized membrane protein
MSTHNVLLVTFDDDTNAYPALTNLEQLGSQGQVTIKAATVVSREADSRLTIKSQVGTDPFAGTATGGLLGALLGVIAGPLGMLLGGTTGMLFGSLFDIDDADATVSVLGAISTHVEPTRTAVLAEVAEQSPEVIDTAMSQLGGNVARWPTDEVVEELAAAEEAQLQAGREAAKRLRQERLAHTKDEAQATVDQLKAKLSSTSSVGAAA